MTYDPHTYWTDAGADPANSEHESRFVRTPIFAHQEERLMALLRTLEFRSVLEVGCGWGRVTKLVSEDWPDVRYLALDLSKERVASAMRKAPGVEFIVDTIAHFDGRIGIRPPEQFDLVLAVECLMHVPPDEIEAVVAKLLALSSKYVVSLDWNAPLPGPIADWNFRHPYAELYGSHLRSVEQIGLQGIYLAEA